MSVNGSLELSHCDIALSKHDPNHLYPPFIVGGDHGGGYQSDRLEVARIKRKPDRADPQPPGGCHLRLPARYPSPTETGRGFGYPSLVRGRFAAVVLLFVAHLGTFVEVAQARSLHGRDVHKHVLAAIVGLNKSKSLSRVEPLHSTCRHVSLSLKEQSLQ